MKKTLGFSVLLTMVFGFVSLAWAKETTTPEEAGKFIGLQKTVCGLVAGANHPSLGYSEDLTEQPTFLNFSRPFPNQALTVTILGVDRGKFEQPPETLYSGKEICVTGMIQNNRGIPEIIVKEPGQIKIK